MKRSDFKEGLNYLVSTKKWGKLNEFMLSVRPNNQDILIQEKVLELITEGDITGIIYVAPYLADFHTVLPAAIATQDIVLVKEILALGKYKQHVLLDAVVLAGAIGSSEIALLILKKV